MINKSEKKDVWIKTHSLSSTAHLLSAAITRQGWPPLHVGILYHDILEILRSKVKRCEVNIGTPSSLVATSNQDKI